VQCFAEATAALGSAPYLAYNMALCHYRMGSFALARKHILEIIERGIREHPELGSYSEEPMVRSVGNSQTLRDTSLVEAFNLKAAIEYVTKNLESAQESLADMPPRSEGELDAVTLHNRALIFMDQDPETGFQKLRFLLGQAVPPPETFGNLLLLYAQYGYHDVAADMLAENPHFRNKYLSPETFGFLEALIMTQVSAEEAFRRFEELAKKHVERLRKLAKQVQDARVARDPNEIKSAMKLYEDAEERYIPVLMAQAKLYWDVKNYPAVERIFRQSMEFVSEHKVWRLNVAHVLFMQETRFKEAIRYYEPIVQQSIDNVCPEKRGPPFFFCWFQALANHSPLANRSSKYKPSYWQICAFRTS
jgi:tetratricopeptide repeat protein 30